MKDDEVYVLASQESTDDGLAIETWSINGVTRDPKVARAWAAGYGHTAYLAEIDGDLDVSGLSAAES